MLEERTGLKKEKDGSTRRWFSDDYFDLFVWSDGDGFRAFDLCYDKPGQQRILAWRRQGGFSHALVDQGEDNPAKNNSPILVPGASEFDGDEVTRLFEQASGGLDPAVYDFIRAKLSSL